MPAHHPHYTSDVGTSYKRALDVELKALDDKTKLLCDREVVQLGELVIVAGADTLPAETRVHFCPQSPRRMPR